MAAQRRGEGVAVLTVVTGGSGVSRSRAVAGEGAPRLRAGGAMFAQVRQASAVKTQRLSTATRSSALQYLHIRNEILMSPCSV